MFFLHLSKENARLIKYGVSPLQNSFRESTKFHVNLTSYNSIPPQSDGFLVDLFNKSGDHGEEWQEITLDISWVPRGKSKPSLVIYANRGSKFHGEMALDDIEFSDYECQKPGKTTKIDWKCKDTNLTLKSNFITIVLIKINSFPKLGLLLYINSFMSL